MPLRVAYTQQTTVGNAAMPRASAPGFVDPGGAALSKLGAEINEFGKQLYTTQRDADLQDRIGKATAEVAELELSMERDQDFRTSPQRFQDQADAIRDKYLDGVTDAAVSTAFRKQFSQIALAKSINVRKDAWAKEKDYNVASLDANIDTYATAAANAKNPAEGALVEQQARISIASAQNGGWLSAVDAGKRERKFLEKRDGALIVRDMSLDPGLTATRLALDPTYAPNIEPKEREVIIDRAHRRADADRTRAEAEAEKARKKRGDELLKDAYGRSEKGSLTRGYVEEIKAFIEPSEYKSLLKSLAEGPTRKDNPQAFAELQGLVYSNPDEAEARAFVLHRNGQIKNETLGSVLSRAREIGRQGGPRTEYERSRLFITDTLKPSALVNDPAGSARYALAVREYDDFANSKGADGKPRGDKEIREKAEEIQKRYALVDMAELARRTAAGAQPTPQAQLQAIVAQGEKLIADRDAKKITQAEFNRKMSDLNKAKDAAEKAAKANGGK